ncbi:helix-turn-helix domain-containing protein [Sphingomonas sp. A2-49]|uniref:AlbA family DNA-binding domain-containing protein n=1 Tax=Sphingomonas sp. A2-49 TaxID=1391375 RepID=UPI0039777879
MVEADLLELIGRGQTEGRRLDFKRDLPGGGVSEVREFLADVTSFANTDGGDIVIGMEEDGNGAASGLPGVSTDGLDKAILAMEGRVRDCVDTRLPAFHIHVVPLASGRAALVLRVPASLLARHRAVYGKISRFHARNSRDGHDRTACGFRGQWLGAAAPSRAPRSRGRSVTGGTCRARSSARRRWWSRWRPCRSSEKRGTSRSPARRRSCRQIPPAASS